MKAIELFDRQLQHHACKPSDGDFLQGKTPLEVIEDWEKMASLRHLSRAELVQLLTQHIKDYRAHKGQRELYFIQYRADEDPMMGGEPVAIWEADVEQLWDTHVLLVPPFLGNTVLPRFQRKD
mgnify:CR=1 FL=1